MLLLPPRFSRAVLLVSLEPISKPRDRVLVRLSEAVLADNPDILDVNSEYNSQVRRRSLSELFLQDWKDEVQRGRLCCICDTSS